MGGGRLHRFNLGKVLNKQSKQQKPQRRKSESKTTTMCYLKCPVVNKIYTAYKETRKYGLHQGKKCQSIETISESQMLNLVYKDLKAVVKYIFKQRKETMFEELKESMMTVTHE